MPNQNECNHIVGYTELRTEVFVPQSAEIQWRKHRKIAKCGKPSWCDVKFNYCPDCGARIDWEKIKEACDENK